MASTIQTVNMEGFRKMMNPSKTFFVGQTGLLNGSC